MKKLLSVILFSMIAVSSMGQTLQEYCQYIEKWEGSRHFTYKDSLGNRTIGVGHKLPKDSKRLYMGSKEIKETLEQDTLQALQGAKRCVKAFDTLPYDAKLIAVDCVFNLGENGFKKFRKTISALNTHDFSIVADELKDSKWYLQTGKRSKNHVATFSKLALSVKAYHNL